MKVIGLTGGIGTGKSAVAQMLRELGAEVVDADRLGHVAYLPGSDAWREVVETFGQEVLLPDGQVDRKRLGAIVFSDPAALARLNAIMHPRMYRMVEERLRQLREKDVQVAVVEAAILIEAGWTPLVDEVWVVVAPEETVVRRLRGRSGLTEQQVRARVRSQLSEQERAQHGDVVLVNDADLSRLRERVRDLWRSRVNGKV